MSNTETQFERATGVIEQTKQCTKCKSSYRTAPGDEDAPCPYCSDARDKNVTKSN